MNPLIDALRAKFKTPGAALKALGLDEDLIKHGRRPKMSAVAIALRDAVKAKTGIAQDAELQDLLSLLDALKKSEEQHVEEINVAENEAREASKEGEIDAPAKMEHVDEFEEDPKTSKPETKKDESKMAGLVTAPNEAVPALAEMKKKEGKDEGMEDGVVNDDPAARLHGILSGKLNPEELEEVGKILLELAGAEEGEDKAMCDAKDSEEEAEDEEEEEKAKDQEIELNGIKASTKNDDGPKVVKTGGKEGELGKEGKAMDAAMVKSLIAKAVDANNVKHRAIRKAYADVKPYVGELAMDANSPDEVYRAALKMREVPNVETIHSSALLTILELLPKAGAVSTPPRREASLGMDAKAQQSFNERFPMLARLQH